MDFFLMKINVSFKGLSFAGNARGIGLRAVRPVHPGRTLVWAGRYLDLPMAGQVKSPVDLLSGRWAKKISVQLWRSCAVFLQNQNQTRPRRGYWRVLVVWSRPAAPSLNARPQSKIGAWCHRVLFSQAKRLDDVPSVLVRRSTSLGNARRGTATIMTWNNACLWRKQKGHGQCLRWRSSTDVKTHHLASLIFDYSPVWTQIDWF